MKLPRALKERLPELALGVSILLVVVMGITLANELPNWHEIVSALPNNGSQVLSSESSHGPPGALPLEPSCIGPNAPWFVISSVRPNLSLCIGGQSLPIMIMSYASGFASWPLALLHPFHADDTFALRRLWLCVAVLSLILSFRLISRIADRETAALACLLTAASSPFLILNTLPVPFETLPCMFLVAALSVWTGGSGVFTLPNSALPRAATARLALGAFLLGLAVAANVKAVFLIAPLAALAWRSGVRPRPVRLTQLAMLSSFAIPLLPMAVFALVDPHAGLSGQVSVRASTLFHNLQISRLASEPVLLFNFASDFASYMESLAPGQQSLRVSWLLVAVAIPLLYCMAVAVMHFVGRRRGSLLAAACGAILITFFAVSALLYKQYPGGNYAPLHEVMGVAMAAGLIDLSRGIRGSLDRRGIGGPTAIALALAAAVLLGGGSLWKILQRGNLDAQVPFSINAAAERTTAEYLRSRRDAGTPILTVTYNHAGVFDALGHGALHTIEAHDYFAACEKSEESLDACVVEHWRWLLTREGGLPLRVVVPLSLAVVDHPAEVIERVESALVSASQQLGLSARLEERFSTRSGVAVIALYRVDGVPIVPEPSLLAKDLPAQDPGHAAPNEPSAVCQQGITEADTRAIFDALRTGDAGDGCALEEVHTERSEMQVVWVKAGSTVDAVLVLPTSCADGRASVIGKVLSMRTPPDAAAACPGGVARIKALIGSELFKPVVEAKEQQPPSSSWPAYLTALAVLALIAAIFLVRHLRGRAVKASEPRPDALK